MFMLFLHLSCLFSTATATSVTTTLSLHDALPISVPVPPRRTPDASRPANAAHGRAARDQCRKWQCRFHHRRIRRRGRSDRKSTRLNSSHVKISYAVFCLKKKKKSCTQKRQTSTV